MGQENNPRARAASSVDVTGRSAPSPPVLAGLVGSWRVPARVPGPPPAGVPGRRVVESVDRGEREYADRADGLPDSTGPEHRRDPDQARDDSGQREADRRERIGTEVVEGVDAGHQLGRNVALQGSSPDRVERS